MEEENTNHDYFSHDFCFLSENHFSLLEEEFFFSKYHLQDQHDHQEISEFGLLNDGDQFDPSSPSLETCLEEIENSKLAKKNALIAGIEDDQAKTQIRQCPKEFASLGLLNRYGTGLTRFKTDQDSSPRDKLECLDVEGKRLSTNEVLSIAGARFIQSSSSRALGDMTCAASHPFQGSFSGFSPEEVRDIELVELLLACAEKVGNQQDERARKLIARCGSLCSSTGNPVERVVYYFREALMEKVDNETGKSSRARGVRKPKGFYPDEMMMSLSASKHAFLEAIPFCYLALFPGIQAIFERIEEAKKVHIVDYGIRAGLQWSVLMQALAPSSTRESRLELLKITAIGTTQKSLIEETGQRLSSFAQSLGIPFSFRVIMVSDMFDLTKDLFEPEPNEIVAIYASHMLRSMLSRPEQLETLMRTTITGLKPSVMVVIEVEASLNSPAFVTRFTEALFFFGAYFDCLGTCMKGDDKNRTVCESFYFGEGIRDIVANEGAERVTRTVTIDVWQAFFARFGLDEAELSASSLYQTRLIMKRFSCGDDDSCSVDTNGRCVIFRWKGTPIQSLSVWKFRQ